ncbi:MAG TPA: hypothetical protein EYN18_03090, partial [Nitrospirales bacterium]|nr:hypothetical protein [Nitrospirales bacterium]
MLLIVGSNGLLGRHVVNYFMATGESVICASHGSGADIRLDLRMPIGDVANIIPEHVTHALICSSVTNIDACYRDPEGTRRFNVTHTSISSSCQRA